jgi:hypothetical protein
LGDLDMQVIIIRITCDFVVEFTIEIWCTLFLL